MILTAEEAYGGPESATRPAHATESTPATTRFPKRRLRWSCSSIAPPNSPARPQIRSRATWRGCPGRPEGAAAPRAARRAGRMGPVGAEPVGVEAGQAARGSRSARLRRRVLGYTRTRQHFHLVQPEHAAPRQSRDLHRHLHTVRAGVGALRDGAVCRSWPDGRTSRRSSHARTLTRLPSKSCSVITRPPDETSGTAVFGTPLPVPLVQRPHH